MSAAGDADGAVVDVVVIGAGLAGLAAARALPNHHCLVLEAENRVGGRLLSRPSEPYWLNLGAHMVGGPDTLAGALVDELGLDARPIRGRLMGMVYGGRRLLSSRAEFLPLLLPLSLRGRLDMVRMGLALRRGSARCNAAERASRGGTAADGLSGFENNRTLADYVGPLGAESQRILRAITERTGADPEEMSAGHGLRSFANVWVESAPGRNLVGGTTLLAQAMAAGLEVPVVLGAPAIEVADMADHVRVVYGHGRERRTVRARAAVLATPAATAARIATGLDDQTARDLADVRSGAFLSVALRTTEKGPMPWDDLYAVSTPDRAFSVLFNMATILREGPRQPGGSLMLFRGARAARDLLEESDEKIEKLFLDDFFGIFPEAKGVVGEVAVQRWPVGAHFSYPGFAGAQARLRQTAGRVVLAGDYLDFPNMEAALASGRRAASVVQKTLEVDRDVGAGAAIPVG